MIDDQKYILVYKYLRNKRIFNLSELKSCKNYNLKLVLQKIIKYAHIKVESIVNKLNMNLDEQNQLYNNAN